MDLNKPHKEVSNPLKFGILLFPLIFSWLTLKKGYSTKARVISFVWMSLILIVGATGDDIAGAIIGLTILGTFVFLLFELFSLLFKQANKRKEKMLAIINDDEAWRDYCIKKKLTPSAQKFVLRTYGLTKEPVELPNQPSKKSNDKQSSLFTVSYSSNTDIDDEDEWKKYDSIEDWKNDLTVIWSGTTDDIEFSYRKDWDSPKERRKVTPHELVFDGNKRIYIKGLCHKRNETIHFNQEKIETKILAGSTRYDFEEWVERRLKVDVEALSDKHNVWI